MIKKLHALIRGLISLIQDFSIQQSFITRFQKSEPALDRIFSSREYFNAYDLYRMKDYSVRSVVLLGAVFAGIHNRKLSRGERSLMTYLGCISPFYDDLFDRPIPNQLNSKKYLFDLQQWEPEGAREKMLYALFLNGYERADGKEKLGRAAYKLHLAQQHSRIQFEEHPEEETIRKVTRMKGGYSALLFRSLLNEPITEQEYAFTLAYGTFLQLLDDVFDILNDHQKGIKTLPGFFLQPESMEKELTGRFRELVTLLKELPAGKRRRKGILGGILILYLSGVCQLRHLKKTGGETPLQELDAIDRSAFELKWKQFAGMGWRILNHMDDPGF